MLFHMNTLADVPLTEGTPFNSHGRLLWIYLLTPGFTLGYHRQVLGVSDITLAKHLRRAQAAALSDPTIADDVRCNTDSITPADGLLMAQRRGSTHLPVWSRRAIGEWRRSNMKIDEIAELFCCTAATVRNPFSGERRLSTSQMLPVGRWQNGLALSSIPKAVLSGCDHSPERDRLRGI
jgi:hypothetical protein